MGILGFGKNKKKITNADSAKDKKYLIIGGGAAGIEAAKTIRENDESAIIDIVMKDDSVHSRCMLHKFISGERDTDTVSFITEDFAEKNKISFHSGCEVKNIDTVDKEVSLSNGEKLRYDKLLIATGSNGAVPPVGAFKKASNVHCFRHLSEAESIKEALGNANKIVVVGAGLVGIDAAYGLLEIGKDVTVVEMAERIIPLQLNDEASNEYKALFEAHGCKFKLGIGVKDTEVDENGKIISLILADDTKLECDMVIVAAGERAAIEGLADTGIEVERFVKVDDHMRTNVKDVFAAGNVTGLSGTWPNAKKQAHVAAINMTGGDEVYEDTYALKNTMNFYGLATLSLGIGKVNDGDEEIVQNDMHGYRRAIIRDGKLDSIILQGNMDYSGIYQYLIKNKIDISKFKDRIFKLTFADFYGIDEKGAYIFTA